MLEHLSAMGVDIQMGPVGSKDVKRKVSAQKTSVFILLSNIFASRIQRFVDVLYDVELF